MDIYDKALTLLEKGTPFAWAAVIEAHGSTPQKAGAAAIFEAAGPIHGTLGGGCLEAESRQRALGAMDTGETLTFDLKLDEVTGWDDALICGGKARIFVNPDVGVNQRTYQALREARVQRQRGVLVTVIHHPDHPVGAAFWISENDGAQHEALISSANVASVIASGKPACINLSTTELFVEPLIPPPSLIIAGAGHIGHATAHLAALMGFEVTIIDDRPSFANPSRLADAHEVICGPIAQEVAAQTIDEDTYMVIVTRGHRNDGAVLAACVNSPAAFIGMIGSRRKSLLIKKGLVEDCVASEEAIARVASPIGLDIGSETVQEIALSITAQLVAVRRQRLQRATSARAAK
jgi:xanthine dehydrogenase accessory factor